MLCLALGTRKPFLSHGCCPFAGLSAAEMWCCSVDQALAGISLYGLEVTVLLSADRKGAAVVVTSCPQLLPRWSSRSLLGEKLPAVQISGLLESRSCLDSSPEAAQGPVPSATLQDKRGICSSIWSLGFWGRQCCICTQLFSFPSACVSGQCWPLLSCSASPWP